MRKLPILLLLLATAAAPALAQAEDDRGGRRQHNQSAEQSEQRSQRSSESRRSEAGEQRSSNAQRSEPGQANAQGAMMRVREHHREQQQQQAAAPTSAQDAVHVRRGSSDSTGASASASGGQTPTNWRARERRVRTIPDTQPATAQSSTSQREGFQGRNRRDYRDGHYNRWSNDWRHDRRYDWRHHRNRHRSIFRLGFYYDPFGWNYRRWSIGSYLYPSYYRSSFWMNDPWQYRLPPAYGPYRWVRYWNDALLVNTYTGEVVDVIHGFFW